MGNSISIGDPILVIVVIVIIYNLIKNVRKRRALLKGLTLENENEVLNKSMNLDSSINTSIFVLSVIGLAVLIALVEVNFYWIPVYLRYFLSSVSAILGIVGIFYFLPKWHTLNNKDNRKYHKYFLHSTTVFAIGMISLMMAIISTSPGS